MGTRFLKVNNYNNWNYNVSPTNSGQSGLVLLAKRDSVNMTEGWERGGITVEGLRELNPDIKLYRTYCLFAKPEWDCDWSDPDNTSYMQCPLTKAELDANDWWLRDGLGQQVVESGNVWFFDPGKPGLKEAFVASIIERNEGKGFDGIVFDYWYPSINNDYFAISGGWFSHYPMPEAYPTDDVWFEQAWLPYIDYIADELHNAGYTVIGNCAGQYDNTDPKIVTQRSKIDGTVYEQWVVGWQGEWLTGSTIASRMSAFNSDPMEAWTGEYWLHSTDEAYDQKSILGLAAYYIAAPVDNLKKSYHHYHDSKIYWLPIWDFDIGTPMEIPRKNADKYFWRRKFTNGIVLMNYEPESHYYTLSRVYTDIEGTIYKGTVEVPAYSALILKGDNMSSYPESIKSFTTKADGEDDILASHINDIQAEIAAIQNTLGTNLSNVPERFTLTYPPIVEATIATPVTFFEDFYRDRPFKIVSIALFGSYSEGGANDENNSITGVVSLNDTDITTEAFATSMSEGGQVVHACAIPAQAQEVFDDDNPLTVSVLFTSTATGSAVTISDMMIILDCVYTEV